MEIPVHAQQAQQKARNKNLYNSYNTLNVPFREHTETRFEGHYDEPTGYTIFRSDPIAINGLENPVDGTSSQRVVIQQRVHGKRLDDSAQITVSAITANGTHEMFQIYPSGVKPPECTELARFILANTSPHTAGPLPRSQGSMGDRPGSVVTDTGFTDNMSHDIDAPWYQGRL